VVPGFVIQGGDPAGNGSGGPGYTVVEPPPRSIQYVRGDVAMAKTQTQPSGASGSQFFVVTGANISQSASLTSDYAFVGKVTSGLDVVEKIGALPTDPTTQAPTAPVVMSSVTVSSR
jgi:peptidyl-prolyl cis-trans isomerase B (cyclophilin B)